MKIGNVEIVWLGHASFLIKGSKTVYVDPYVLTGETPKADIILVTHDHYDHCDAGKVSQVQKEDTVILTTTPSARKLKGNVKTISPGQAMDVKGVQVKAIPAYNIGKPYHPKGVGIGFVFTIDGTTIYHAGDTDLIPEMEGLGKVDVALLPIGGTYTMNEAEAADAAVKIKPRIVIPMHYGTISGTDADPGSFKNMVQTKDPNIDVRILG